MSHHLKERCTLLSQRIQGQINSGSVTNTRQVETLVINWAKELERGYPSLIQYWGDVYSTYLASQGYDSITITAKLRDFRNSPPQSTGVLAIPYSLNGKNFLCTAHKGDSRAYVFTGGNLTRLTQDHSSALESFSNEDKARYSELLDNVTSIEELDRNPALKKLFNNRNKIESAFGAPRTELTLSTRELNPRDIVILTTDGVHDNLTSGEIAHIVDKYKLNPKKIAELLAKASSSRGKKSDHIRGKPDDTTALVFIPFKDSRASKIEITSHKRFNKGDRVVVAFKDQNQGGWFVDSLNPDGTYKIIRESDRVTLDKIHPDIIEKEIVPVYPVGSIVRVDFGNGNTQDGWVVVSVAPDGKLQVKKTIQDRTYDFLLPITAILGLSKEESMRSRFLIGQRVNVKRSDGNLENDWKISSIEGNIITVHKVTDPTLSKHFTYEGLSSLNS